MKSVNIHEAKTHLSRLIEEAAPGEEIFAKAGAPRARLIGIAPARQRRRPGVLKGKIRMHACSTSSTP